MSIVIKRGIMQTQEGSPSSTQSNAPLDTSIISKLLLSSPAFQQIVNITIAQVLNSMEKYNGLLSAFLLQLAAQEKNQQTLTASIAPASPPGMGSTSRDKTDDDADQS